MARGNCAESDALASALRRGCLIALPTRLRQPQIVGDEARVQLAARLIGNGRRCIGMLDEKTAVLLEPVGLGLAFAGDRHDEGHLRRDAGMQRRIKCGTAVAQAGAALAARERLEWQLVARDVNGVVRGKFT